MKRRAARRAAVVAVFVAFAASANAQLANPDFNGGLSGWGVSSCGGSAAFWSPNDVFPWVTSGSATLVGFTKQNNDHTCLYLFSNVSLLPTPLAAKYAFGGIISVDRTPAGRGDVQFGIVWLSGLGSCLSSPNTVGGNYSDPIPEGTPWKVSWTAVSPPAGATAYCLFVVAGKDYESFSAHLDKAFVVPLP